MSDFDDIRLLWQRQPVQPPEVDMSELRKKAHRFHRTILLRNIAEWGAAAFVVVMFSALAVSGEGFHWVSRVGGGAVALAAGYIAYRIYRDGRLRRLPDPGQDTRAYIEAYRRQLLGQADLIRNVPRWYIAPFVPGFTLFYLGFLLKQPERWLIVAGLFAGSLLFMWGIAWGNRRAAAKLERRAGALSETA